MAPTNGTRSWDILWQQRAMNLDPHESESGRIFIVEDDSMFRESLSRTLSDAGFATTSFGDGVSALRHLTEEGPPDMILLDWKMPGMTGIQVLRQLRDRRVEAPVVFLTVLSDQIYEEAGLLGGAVDFIEKSRSFSILLHRLELILNGQKRRQLAPVAPQQAADLDHGDFQL